MEFVKISATFGPSWLYDKSNTCKLLFNFKPQKMSLAAESIFCLSCGTGYRINSPK